MVPNVSGAGSIVMVMGSVTLRADYVAFLSPSKPILGVGRKPTLADNVGAGATLGLD